MNKIELLSPVGDWECLKAAVQNGADSVYFGSGNFNARASANNFAGENLEKAIYYAKLHGVQTHLTLNTLIKDDEFDDAIELAKTAYEAGIDAIIVQDLGLATYLIEHFPDLPIHGSTQMTIHNLEGALALQHLGFKRAVLSRELSLSDIEYICNNSNIEIETFLHGALCISYSGQCLMSSMIGARSGNRGRCAQPCRLPYELMQKKEGHTYSLGKGYLMSPKDLCGIDYIPDLIKAGVMCFKIEGRMKSPEYVATVTRIYRKYLDLALSDTPYVVEKQDKKDLLQIFNRGGFSTGHLDNSANKNLVFKEQPGNIGLYIGNISYYQPSNGRVSIKLLENLEIGDTISFQKEPTRYTISELMQNNTNTPSASSGTSVTFGKMKGNIHVGDRVYKIASKSLVNQALASLSRENIKIPISCNIKIHRNEPISLTANFSHHGENFHTQILLEADILEAKNAPLTSSKIQNQLLKTGNTPFIFSSFSFAIEDNIFLPGTTSVLNELRRKTISQIESLLQDSFHRKSPTIKESLLPITHGNISPNSNYGISLLINIPQLDFEYQNLKDVDRIYIPLKYFTMKKYETLIKKISSQFDTYIYMPSIVRANYKNLILTNLEVAFRVFSIKGCVLSNISNILAVKRYHHLFPDKQYEHITNYTLNVYNSHTIDELITLNVKNITISPELDKTTIASLPRSSFYKKEGIVYGKIPVMTTNYCFLGQTNKCYPTCGCHCQENATYSLKDRMNLEFRILPDNIQTVTTIYNSKTLSISPVELNLDYARIDVLDESIDEINTIIQTVKQGKRLEGEKYTNGNLNRQI